MRGTTRIAIEGNIGIGKSTVLEAIRQKTDTSASFACEPVEEWLKHGLLDRDEDESADSALARQLAILVSLFSTHTRKLQESEDSADDAHRFLFTERSLEANREVFAAATLLSQRTRSIYDLTWQNLMSATGLADAPQLIVYLHAPFEVLLARIRARGRWEESWIDETYLRLLDGCYENWLRNVVPSNVIRIDASTSTPAQIADTIMSHLVKWF